MHNKLLLIFSRIRNFLYVSTWLLIFAPRANTHNQYRCNLKLHAVLCCKKKIFLQSILFYFHIILYIEEEKIILNYGVNKILSFIFALLKHYTVGIYDV